MEQYTVPNNFEVANIIVIELVNEHKFMEHIQPFINDVVKHHSPAKELQEEIIKFQYTQKCCGIHTHSLKQQNETIKKIVTVEILKHYWEQYSDKPFDLEADVPGGMYDCYVKKPKEPEQIKEEESFNTKLPNMVEDYNEDVTNTLDHLPRNVKNKTWVNTTLENLEKFKSGAWAWNTLTEKFQKCVLGPGQPRRWQIDIFQQSKVDIFTLFVYEYYFNKLYSKQMTKWDIPPQVRYLWENKTFEIEPQATSRLHRAVSEHADDNLDALATGYGMGKQRLKNMQCPKLFTFNLPAGAEYERRFIQAFPQAPQQLLKTSKGEIPVNTIETITYVNGTPVHEMNDDQIFSLIAKTEKDIEKLEAINKKPKKLTAKIEKMQESIIALVKIVDERN